MKPQRFRRMLAVKSNTVQGRRFSRKLNEKGAMMTACLSVLLYKYVMRSTEHKARAYQKRWNKK